MAEAEAATETTEPVGVPPEQVHVRMYRALGPGADGDTAYRGLLGDCFLIRLSAGEAKSHILIDCGMLLGSPQAEERMRAVANHIVETCDGRLDLLVITHEHWDHLSGFSQAKDVLLNPARLAINEVWMAWTEDPKDDLAQSLRARFDRTGFALAGVASQVRENGARFGADAARTWMGGLDTFMGAPVAGPAQARPRLATRDIIQNLKELRAKVCYLTPGETHHTPGAVSLPAHVLGPPRDLKLLFRDNPSTVNPETYLDAPSVNGPQMMRMAEGDLPDPARDSPFAPDYCRFTLTDLNAQLAAVDDADARTYEFLRQHYYGTAGMEPWRKAAVDRRRIDADFLGPAGAMALKLDSDTNNTSLVLAFELPGEPHDVMLFAGDAQVGNWQSWSKQTYTAPDGGTVTSDQLLARTLLYKVGHHGSHNATLAAQGLELMTNDRLFAMIPTDEDLAKRQGSGWQMPNPRVQSALKRRTSGRILRNDRRYPSKARSDVENEKLRQDPEIKAIPPDFLDKLNETDLFLEYPLLRKRSRMTVAQARTLIQTAELPAVQSFAVDAAGGDSELPSFDAARDQALVVGSDVVSFTIGVEADFRQAITDSSLFSQLVALRKVGDGGDPMAFFDAYFETLLGLGWIEQQRETAAISLDSSGFDVHEAVIGVISTFLTPVAGPAAVAAVVAVLNGLHQINADKPFITLFDKRTRHGKIGRFQITSVRHDPTQGLMAEVMAFALDADEVVTQVLFFKLRKGNTELRRSFGSLSIDTAALADIRPNLAAKVRAFRTALIAEADLGPVPGGN